MKPRREKTVILCLLCLLLAGCAPRQQGAAPMQSSAVPETSAETAAETLEGMHMETPPVMSVEIPSPTDEPEDAGFAFTICFAGDINLDENWDTTRFMDTQPGGIYDCISPELVEIMQTADIMCLNNEFTYSTGGAPLPGRPILFGRPRSGWRCWTNWEWIR